MRFKLLIKNKFISTIFGTLSLYFGIAFILPLNTLSVYITSYIHLNDKSVTMHHGLFIHLFFSFGTSFSLPLGGYLENILGFFETIIFGYIIVFLANLIFIFQQNIWICYFLSLVLGMGVGISASLLGKNITFYAPNKKGIISGVMGLGVGIITSLFGFAGEKIINFNGVTLKEDDNYYPPEIARNTYLYFIIGECFIPIGLIFALLLIYEYKPEDNNHDKSNLKKNEDERIDIKEKNEEKNEDKNEEKKDEEKNEEKKDEEKNEEENDEKKDEENDEKNEEEKEKENEFKKDSKKRVKQVIKTLRFYRLALASFLINISISFLINTARTFGALIGINGNALQFIGILQIIVVIIAGPGLGYVVDKKGPLLIVRIIVLSGIIPPILLTFFMTNDYIFISCLVIYVLNIIGISVSLGPYIMEVYGIQESVILGGIISGFAKLSDISTTVSAFIFSLICDNEKDCLKIKYAYAYFISGICCVISSLLMLIEKNEKFKYYNASINKKLIDNENEDLKDNQDEDYEEK